MWQAVGLLKPVSECVNAMQSHELDPASPAAADAPDVCGACAHRQASNLCAAINTVQQADGPHLCAAIRQCVQVCVCNKQAARTLYAAVYVRSGGAQNPNNTQQLGAFLCSSHQRTPATICRSQHTHTHPTRSADDSRVVAKGHQQKARQETAK